MPDNDPIGTTQSDTSVAPTSGDAPAANVDGGAQSRADDGQYGKNYVYGADANVAEWKKFKTPEELDRLTDQMYNIMQQGSPQPAAPAAPQIQPNLAPPVPAPATAGVPDADMWLSDSAAAADAHFNARIGQVQKEVLAPQLAGLHNSQAQASRALAVQSHTDAFSRWGPEIDMQMAAIPVENRNFEMYTEAVKLVKGAHAGEISQEALDKAVADEIERRTAAGTIRSGGDTSAAVAESLDFNSESLGDRWAHIAEETTPEGRYDFFRKMYPDLSLAEAQKKFLELTKKGNAVSAEANS